MDMMRSMPGFALALGAVLLCGCTAQPPPVSGSASPQHPLSILASSTPAAGSVVNAPVNLLKLHFNPPARLDEVAIKGPDGLMPMMIHGVGEVPEYSVPVAGLGAGNYAVTWRATSAGREERGNFAFTVR